MVLYFDFSAYGYKLSLANLLSHWDARSSGRFLGSVISVLGTVLGITMSISLIIVSLTANRYTPKILELFVKSRLVRSVFFTYIGSILFSIWTLSLVRNAEGVFVPDFAVYLVLVLVSICVSLLIPYFYYLLYIFNPHNVAKTIKKRLFLVLDDRKTPAVLRQELSLVAIEQLSDIAKKALENYETALTLSVINDLGAVCRYYLKNKKNDVDDWFIINSVLFPEYGDHRIQEINKHGYWFEVKIFNQLQTIFTLATNKMHEASSLTGMVIRDIAIDGAELGDKSVVNYSVKQMNTLLKIGIQQLDRFSVYNLYYHYSILGMKLIQGGWRYEKGIAKAFVYYGLMAEKAGLTFILKTACHDLSQMIKTLNLERLTDKRNYALLKILLKADRAVIKMAHFETSIPVKKTIIILAAFFREEGFHQKENYLMKGIKKNSGDSLDRLKLDMKKKQKKTFWEITDRGRNFDYVSPKYRDDLSTLLGKL
jgi:hypothetical protein